MPIRPLAVDEDHVAHLLKTLPYINGSDLTAITPGMPYKPNFTKAYIDKLRDGGAFAIHAALVVWYYEDFARAIKRVGWTLRFIDEHAADLVLVQTVEDIARARAEGKLGLIMHFHTPSVFDDDLALLAVYHKLGLRVQQLTYQGRSLVGDGCEEPNPGGLSSFGIRVVQELNRLGVVVDLSHTGERTFMDALEVTTSPVLNTHGCCKAVRNHPRNLTDAQLRALAAKGGVFGIMAKSDCLVEGGQVKGSTLDDFLEHLQHAVDVIGVDHVGIGLENAHGIDDGDLVALQGEYLTRMDKPYERGRVPKDYKLEKFYSAKGVDDAGLAKVNLIRGLLARGYADADIGKILGGNFMRVYGQVWGTQA